MKKAPAMVDREWQSGGRALREKRRSYPITEYDRRRFNLRKKTTLDDRRREQGSRGGNEEEKKTGHKSQAGDTNREV